MRAAVAPAPAPDTGQKRCRPDQKKIEAQRHAVMPLQRSTRQVTRRMSIGRARRSSMVGMRSYVVVSAGVLPEMRISGVPVQQQVPTWKLNCRPRLHAMQ